MSFPRLSYFDYVIFSDCLSDESFGSLLEAYVENEKGHRDI
jgi:hypothetical protein